MRGKKLSADKTKRNLEQAAAYAKGGKAHMFKQQAAGPDRPDNTGKTSAPGGRFAKGGKHKTKFNPAQPAKAGVTSAR